MSYAEIKCYTVVCDSCGESYEGKEYMCWLSQETAEEEALADEWTTANGKHHCQECPPLGTCPDCEQTVRGNAQFERDGCCLACWRKREERKAGQKLLALAQG